MTSNIVLAVTLALFVAPAYAEDLHPLMALGKNTYKTFCSRCHGPEMVNPGTSSFDLRKWRLDNKDGFTTSVLKGKGDMPAWGDILLPEETEALWVYVATRGGKEPFPEAKPDDG